MFLKKLLQYFEKVGNYVVVPSKSLYVFFQMREHILFWSTQSEMADTSAKKKWPAFWISYTEYNVLEGGFWAAWCDIPPGMEFNKVQMNENLFVIAIFGLSAALLNE